MEASSDSFLHYLNASEEKSPLNIFLEKELSHERNKVLLKMSKALKGKQKRLFDLSVCGRSRKEVIEIMDITSVDYSSIKTRLIKRLKIVFGFNEKKSKQ